MTASKMQPTLFPPLYLVTPEPETDKPFSHFIARLEHALNNGVGLVQLRAKKLTAEQYAALAEKVLASCRRHTARLMLNAPADLVLDLQADGVHLTSAGLMACAERPLPPHLFVSASCHDVHQVMHAGKIGADLLTISPVLPTLTHPKAVPLGWTRFSELAALTETPAYALGGMTRAMLPEAQAAGAHGIAAIRAFWA